MKNRGYMWEFNCKLLKNRITLFSSLSFINNNQSIIFHLLIGVSYSFSTLIKVLNSETVPGGSFRLWKLDCKIIIAELAGWSFGLAGFIFQTMLEILLQSLL